MEKIIIIPLIGAAFFFASCTRDYQKDLVGKWHAGKASFNNNDLMVTIRADNTLTAQITNSDMKPVQSTYTVKKDRFVIKFSGFDMSYKIIRLDKDTLVMKSRYGRITWKRLK